MRIGTLLIVVGAGLLVLGLLVRFAPWTVSWFGNLPGDMRVESDNTRVFIPITSMIITSIGLTLIAILVARLVRGG